MGIVNIPNKDGNGFKVENKTDYLIGTSIFICNLCSH